MILPINEIICGDCLSVMKDWPDNSFDGIVTDPPYGLGFMGKEWDTFGNVKTYGRTTQGYKNRQFKHPTGKVLKTGINSPAAVAGDYDHSLKAHLQFQQWFTIWAAEALRIVKPGAIMLIFGGTRTYHRLACAVEDAGWQIRDCMMWLYGSGFPKSHNISKAIDKAKGAKREQLVEKKEDIFGEYKEGSVHKAGMGSGKSFGMLQTEANKENYTQTMIDTTPATDLAKLWDGYGTALKPAWEPILVCMKPLDGTFAQNAEKWGVAGLNIDGGRIGYQSEKDKEKNLNIRHNSPKNICYSGGSIGKGDAQGNPQGRWPSNVILNEEAAAMLDEQSGVSKSNIGMRGIQQRHDVASPETARPKQGTNTMRGHSDSGGASRFFYTAKASRAERNAGLEGMEAKLASSMPGRRNADDMSQSKTDHDVTNRFCTTKQNTHPTVKPLKLMEYLCRLLKPPSEHPILLDPFTGSGTTLMAAVNTGWDYVGIEKEADYVEIARRRVAWSKKQEIGQLGLF